MARRRLFRLLVVLLVLSGCARDVAPRDDGLPPDGGAGGVLGVPNATPPPSRTPCPTCPPTPTPSPTPATGARVQPVPFGASFRLANGGKVFVFTLTEAYRGEEAWQRIVAANQFNDPPPAGMEYLLLYAEVEYVEGPGDETLRLDAWAFRLVTDNQVLTPPAVVDPEPAFEFEFFPGGAAGGWMSWTVYEDDAAPLLGYGLEYDGSGGTYFVAGP